MRIFCQLVIFGALFSNLVYGQAACDPVSDLGPALDQDFIDLSNSIKNLKHFTSTDEQIENALCGNPGPVTKDEIEKHFSKIRRAPVKEDVFGLSITDDPHKISLLRKLLTVEQFSVTGEMAQPTYGKLQCQKVSCVLDEVFGAKVGSKALYALDRFGVNLSHVRAKDLDPWTESEVDNILETLDDLPPSLFPLDNNQMLAHYDRSKDMGAKYGTASIIFFRLFDEESPQNQRQIIYHEIGHVFGDHVNGAHDHSGHLDEDTKWRRISKWEPREDGTWNTGDPYALPSVYAGETPKEDFAESFTAYRYNPAHLKRVSPDKYDYMKNYVYLGKEYLSEETCKMAPSFINNIKKADVSSLSGFDACKNELGTALFLKKGKEELQRCIQKDLALKSIEKADIKDPKTKASIKKFGVNALIKQYGPVSERELNLYGKKFVNELRESFAREYYTLSECEIPAKHGNQFFKGLSGPSLKRALNEFSLQICELSGKAKSLTSDDPNLIKSFDQLLKGL